MSGMVKSAGAGLAALVLYINSTFGEVFYILVGLLVLDAILNYADEKGYLQKLSWYSVSSGAAFYVQNASMSGIQIARGLIVLLAIHELTQVSFKIKGLYADYKASHPTDALPDTSTVNNDLDQLAAKVAALLQTPSESLKSEGPNGE